MKTPEQQKTVILRKLKNEYCATCKYFSVSPVRFEQTDYCMKHKHPTKRNKWCKKYAPKKKY